MMKIAGIGFLVKDERNLLSSQGSRGRMTWLLNSSCDWIKGRNLNRGFPCWLYVVLLGFILNFLLNPCQFKKTVFLPSTMYNVVSLLGNFCLQSLFQDLNFSVAECLLLACVSFTSQVRLLCVSDMVFFSLIHVLPLAGFTRGGIFPCLVVFLKKDV